MEAFLSSFMTYIVQMICLVVLGLCGGYIGIQLRKRKNESSENGGSEQ
ncbi:MAG: hypothetical protein IJ679_05430 [Lachnospiraceae bacterium]|nr:hypothetical protein [Lachnospiraceae bacterium]